MLDFDASLLSSLHAHGELPPNVTVTSQRSPIGAEDIVIVDGVVASGVTLMAMMQLAAGPASTVRIFTCQSTLSGALALDRDARSLGVELFLHIGHVSGVLNGRFYAVEPDAPERVSFAGRTTRGPRILATS